MKHIIHFTDKFSKIENILKTSTLKLAYCKEEFYLGKERISSAAHPMVCFSEYNINELMTKTITYGQYGIALSAKWVTKNKIHPVLYIDKDSDLACSLAKLLRARQNKQDSMLPDNLRLPIMTIKCFTKNSVGNNSRLSKKDFNFRDECEWRFVPSKKDIGNGLISQDKSTFQQKKNQYNDSLKTFPLKFNYNDIEEIFVTTEDESTMICKTYNIEKNKILISNWKYNTHDPPL